MVCQHVANLAGVTLCTDSSATLQVDILQAAMRHIKLLLFTCRCLHATWVMDAHTPLQVHALQCIQSLL